MIERVRCTDASAKQLAQISNDLLRKSKNLTRQAYEKGILSSASPKFTSQSVQKFYNITDFYDKNGEISEIAKPVFAQILEDFGLKRDATLLEFKSFILNVYK